MSQTMRGLAASIFERELALSLPIVPKGQDCDHSNVPPSPARGKRQQSPTGDEIAHLIQRLRNGARRFAFSGNEEEELAQAAIEAADALEKMLKGAA